MQIRGLLLHCEDCKIRYFLSTIVVHYLTATSIFSYSTKSLANLVVFGPPLAFLNWSVFLIYKVCTFDISTEIEMCFKRRHKKFETINTID